MSLPSVAIVIPTRNRPELLKRCLSRLVSYVSLHHECSITVSDDGNASETRDVLTRDMGIVQVIQGPRRGPAANRNYGAAHSAGDIIVFLDDDCIPDPDLIATYQAAASRNPDTGVFEGRISATRKATGFADSVPENETGGYLWSCNFAIRRELFNNCNGFDGRFPFAAVEDVDLYFRVKKLSAVLFLPEARVWHDPERRQGWRLVKHHTLSVLLFLHIHGPDNTDRKPSFFVKMAVRTFLFQGAHHLRTGATHDPEQLIFHCWACLQLALMLTFWRFHPALARRFYPPCCHGCQSIHESLETSSCPAPSLRSGEG
jgi:GT2 family glycosyltransferase